ncbi:4a-hydroxytetrahydrobiopterin dehydratase [Thauera sp. CAU 1555]|uniref:Putative pterin-4-alpha-carbinolamine dehydratase n=1 Tax=Thauera sedimentorum TaxID=2767595 RepID=A0ABR9B9J8_9RHOO|nr:4a-hydroxytetrahydrobiopterin dehydratase [Thauera sedimentorum]MBC9072100.1 4a-hydroxytetrahydrobiopterin dehydratase [Thauera sedimentorum]MBD8503019.1 4a-hydroxytetrahydrobiopterin dehydratase [Thauera sedimentorum]
MSEELQDRVCTPCRGGIPPLARAEAEAMLSRVPGWELADEASCLVRRYEFGDFAEALAFVQRLGAVAEEQGHHPDIAFGWGWATVSWQTKKIRGLHENDFIMAARTDALLAGRR